MRTSRLLLLLTCLTLGCGGSKLGSVSGTVTLDGKPLAHASIAFQPMGDKVETGLGSFGKTDANGRYTLQLVDASAAGAVVGKHRVAISAYADDKFDPKDDSKRSPPNKVPAKYNLNSELTFEVRPGANEANFELTSR